MAFPGIDLPLEQTSELPTEGADGNWHKRAIPLTVRERVMLDLMAALKNKPGWEKKIFDDKIVGKWRAEALSSGDSWRTKDESQTGGVQGLAPEATSRQRVVSEAMFQYCVEELRSQAPVSEERGFTEVFDANAAVYISDTAVDHDTKMALRAGVAPLEDVRDALKDWHPGSDGKVLDLVHPSLYPLMYGTSRILCEGIVPLNNCAQFSGRGEVFPCPRDEEVPWAYSAKHQWLPCEVRLDDTDNAVITSYINNLQPVAHKSLYQVIEQVITKSVPMWKLALRSTMFQHKEPRINLCGDGYDHEAAEADYDARCEEGERAWQRERDERKKVKAQDDGNDDCDDKADNSDESGDDSDEESYYHDDDDYPDPYQDKYIRLPDPEVYTHRERKSTVEAMAKFEQMLAGGDDSDDESYYHDDDDYPDPYQDKYIRLPDPEVYTHRERKSTVEATAKFEQMFAEKRLQVIVKLANIHLSTEKPSYDGGSWHIEGLPNEHICASALYYYDSVNVTDSHLAFRENVNNEYLDAQWKPGPTYEQHYYHALWEIFGLYGEDNMGMPPMQVVGQVSTREDRLLVFPNVLQHCVQPFQLADTTKPGHRKILALFLVDPSIRIPSTANIPPQQRDWWAKQVDLEGLLGKLPAEISEQIYNEVEDFPLGIERAKEVRAELMAERGAHNDSIASGEYSGETYCFCEH